MLPRGMIGALTSLLDQPDIPLGVAGNALLKIFVRDGMGAGASDEKPFQLQQLQAQEIAAKAPGRARLLRAKVADQAPPDHSAVPKQ